MYYDPNRRKKTEINQWKRAQEYHTRKPQRKRLPIWRSSPCKLSRQSGNNPKKQLCQQNTQRFPINKSSKNGFDLQTRRIRGVQQKINQSLRSKRRHSDGKVRGANSHKSYSENQFCWRNIQNSLPISTEATHNWIIRNSKSKWRDEERNESAQSGEQSADE